MTDQPDPQQRYTTLLRRFNLVVMWTLWLIAVAAFAFAAPALLRLEFLRPIPLAVSILMLGSLGFMAANNPFGWWRVGVTVGVMLGVAGFLFTLCAWVTTNPELARVGSAVFIGSLLAGLLLCASRKNTKGLLLTACLLIFLPGTIYFAEDLWSTRAETEIILHTSWYPVKVVHPERSGNSLAVVAVNRWTGGTMRVILWDEDWSAKEFPLPPAPGRDSDWLVLGEDHHGNIIISNRFTHAPWRSSDTDASDVRRRGSAL